MHQQFSKLLKKVIDFKIQNIKIIKNCLSISLFLFYMAAIRNTYQLNPFCYNSSKTIFSTFRITSDSNNNYIIGNKLVSRADKINEIAVYPTLIQIQNDKIHGSSICRFYQSML